MSRRVIGIVHNEPAPPGCTFSHASMDVMIQVEAVERALEELEGYSTVRIPFTKDVGSFVQRMEAEKVDMAFNLCESVDEDARLGGHPAAVLELFGIPFSGSPAVALMLTTDKVMTKRLLSSAGIITPKYAVSSETESLHPLRLRYPVIVKPRFEDASIGIDQESIFENEAALKKGLPDFTGRFGTVLIEEYIAGREFNVALMGYPTGIPLPVAEIDFSQFPEDMYRIVGYRAKWDTSTFEYHHTPRRFSRRLPSFLVAAVKRIAVQCFELFMLRDYGRVDMRVDTEGRVYVLEVNANPCLSPDAGFAAAAHEAGMSYSHMIGGLLSFVIKRSEEDARLLKGARFCSSSRNAGISTAGIHGVS